MDRTFIAIAIVIIILIVVIVWQRRAQSSANTEDLSQFSRGFWRASAVDCDAGGFSSAYLYIAPSDGLHAKGYIVTVGGAENVNSAIDIEFIGGDFADVTIDDKTTRMSIARDFALDIMAWLDEDGVALFTWEKNSDITRAIFPVAQPEKQDDASSIAI